MFGSRILEVAIGVVFVFLLVSIICSAVREAIEAWVKSRAAYLEHGIRELLHDPTGTGLAKSLYEHPLVSGLYTGSYTEAVANRSVANADPKKRASGRRLAMLANGGDLPSYIPTRNFALALMDMAARGPDTDVVSGHPSAPSVTLENIQRNIMGLGNPAVQRVLLTAIDSAQGDLVGTRQAIEKWYDSAMDRVSGWYKRSTSWVLFWIGLGVALMLNVNTITIADYLYRNDAARQAFVARAGQAVGDSSLPAQSAQEARATLDAAALPIGWSKGWGAPLPRSQRTENSLWFDFAAPAVGLLLTALAATFGAPFWFDLLNKMMVIRSTVKPHEKSGEESSEDRQTTKDAKADAVGAVVVREPGLAPRPEAVPSPAFSRAFTPPPAPRDRDSNVDGCEVEASGPTVMLTSDEELPPSFGGVG
jgi:hypothetical protein